jgi:hypothetical protein
MTRRLKTAALVALVLGTVSCGSEPVEDDPIIRPVRYEEVLTSGAARTRSFSGTAQAGLESRLSFTGSGPGRRSRASIPPTTSSR